VVEVEQTNLLVLLKILEQMVDLVVEDLQQDPLQNLVDLETLLLLVPLKVIMEVQVMVNQESLELVVAVVEQVVQELQHKCQELKQEMVEQEQQTILQEVV
jgi:tRNA(Phe) wybutosine-synthesizing methylase Tyw3